MKTHLLVFIEVSGNDIYVGDIFGNTISEAAFQYDNEYLKSTDCRPISIGLPLQDEPFSVEKTRIFFEGLLPEGFTRRCIANKLRADENDYLTILSALGSECLGAIKILTEKKNAKGATYVSLTEEEVKAFAQEGATESASLVTRAHLSLAGASGKAGLYYNEKEDQWFLPFGTAPSTHIVKQSHVRFERIVANERLSLLTAKHLGIEVPESFIVKATTKDEDVLFATKRYDRIINEMSYEIQGMKVPFRLHQEDFAQALGISAIDKYERMNAGYLKAMFEVLRNYSANPIEDQMKLWDITVFNYLIGNTDNHIKNVSLLYSADLKSVRLAPAYDIVSTMIYKNGAQEMSFAIGGVYDITQINREEFEKEAKNIGLGVNLAMKNFDKMVSGFKGAIEDAAKELEDEGISYIHEIKEKILQCGGIARV